MAEAKEKAPTAPLTLANVVNMVNKNCGAGTISLGSASTKDPPRLPTGCFAVDYATGGGLPFHATSCFWGADQSAKTTLALKTMATSQHICFKCFKMLDRCTCNASPHITEGVFVDIEGTHDREWAEALGNNPAGYHLVLADSGEQAVDVVDYVLRADNCGLVVVDSVAGLVPSSEFESSAEDGFIAVQSRLISRFVRKTKQRLIIERKRGHNCLVIFINQMRLKIGGYGDPETMPGGFAMKHEFSLLLRMGKKAMATAVGKADAKYFDHARDKGMASRHSFSIKKEKVLTLSNVGEFVIVKETIPTIGLTKGDFDELNTVLTYAKDYGFIRQNEQTKKYIYREEVFDKARDLRAMLVNNPIEVLQLKLDIITTAKEAVREKTCQE